jgi:hypothetical protein
MTKVCEFPCDCPKPNDCSHDDSCTGCEAPATIRFDDKNLCDKHNERLPSSREGFQYVSRHSRNSRRATRQK